MSALAEALVAAQRRAMQAVEKAYVAGALERDAAEAELILVGARDEVDRTALLDALDSLRRWGAALPAEPKPTNGAPDAKASPAQLARIRRDLEARNLPMLAEADAARLTKERASAMIDALASPDYDPNVIGKLGEGALERLYGVGR